MVHPRHVQVLSFQFAQVYQEGHASLAIEVIPCHRDVPWSNFRVHQPTEVEGPYSLSHRYPSKVL